MSQLRHVAGRTFTTLWVAALGFLALAQPAHALFESPSEARIAQAVGAVLIGILFSLRGAIHQQPKRLGAFPLQLRRLRAVVRTLAVSTIAATNAEAAEAAATNETHSPPPAPVALPLWQNPGGASSAASAGTSLQTAASAPRRPIPPSPPTTA